MKRLYFLSPLIIQKLIWIPTNLIFGIFGRMEIRGIENLTSLTTNAVFALNHTSELDVFLLPAALPFWSKLSPMFYTSRERSFYSRSGWRQRFYGGSLFKACGAYPVFVGLNDYDASLKNQIRILRDGGCVCIFPEGRTTQDGEIHEAKGGVAHLSYATKLPIVPVRVSGAFRMKLADLLFFRRKLSVAFGEPIYGIAKLERIPSYDIFRAEANKVMEAIRAL